MTDLMTIDTFADNQEQFMTDLIETKGNNLPAKIEDVLQIFEFTDFKAKAWKIMTDKMGKLEEHTESYNAALRSGQKWGIAALYAQKRMGEITRDMKPLDGNDVRYQRADKEDGKIAQLRKTGIDPRRSAEAEQLAKYPEIVEQVIENAKDRGEIPTKTAVLNRIKIEHHRKNSEGRIIKHNDRVIKEIPKAVKDYFNAMSDYKEELKLALEVAKRELFSPESINIISKKHEELRSMMNTLEGLI